MICSWYLCMMWVRGQDSFFPSGTQLIPLHLLKRRSSPHWKEAAPLSGNRIFCGSVSGFQLLFHWSLCHWISTSCRHYCRSVVRSEIWLCSLRMVLLIPGLLHFLIHFGANLWVAASFPESPLLLSVWAGGDTALLEFVYDAFTGSVAQATNSHWY